jgi:hypothetical protein
MANNVKRIREYLGVDKSDGEDRRVLPVLLMREIDLAYLRGNKEKMLELIERHTFMLCVPIYWSEQEVSRILTQANMYAKSMGIELPTYLQSAVAFKEAYEPLKDTWMY